MNYSFFLSLPAAITICMLPKKLEKILPAEHSLINLQVVVVLRLVVVLLGVVIVAHHQTNPWRLPVVTRHPLR